jgi:hypothetical protein
MQYSELSGTDMSVLERWLSGLHAVLAIDDFKLNVGD